MEEAQHVTSALYERRLRRANGITDGHQRTPALLQISNREPSNETAPHVTQARISVEANNIVPDSAGRTLFHNYLRAFCQFEPPAHVDKNDQALLMTVRLEAGDLILVHSVHANGWADGTVLSTGARGWLPTNYCETFDHPSLRNLLTALTQFWDLLGVSDQNNASTFARQTYIRPLIAGVRHLLETADCLHRDAPLVLRSAGLRRLRKGLLADLSVLVQIAKRLQDVIGGPFAGEVLSVLLDDMTARAFKIVTRAVGFVDMLVQAKRNPESGSDAATSRRQTRHASREQSVETQARSGQAGLVAERDERSSRLDTENNDPLIRGQQDPDSNWYRADGGSENKAVRTANLPVSHRLSIMKIPGGRSEALASQRLAKAHDLCISHIGSFIGLHLHPSRPASELAITTKRLISACEDFLTVIDNVAIKEVQGSESLRQARTALAAQLEDLMRSTTDVFQQSGEQGEDIVMLPEQNNRLINVGTSLIRRVGDCVVQTRKVIEQIGDFDLASSLDIRQDDVSEGQALPGSANRTEPAAQTSEPEMVSIPKGSLQQSPTHLPPVHVVAPQPGPRSRAIAPETAGLHDLVSIASRPSQPSSAIHTGALPDPSISVTKVFESPQVSTLLSDNVERLCSVGVSVTDSDGTYATGLRDSHTTAPSRGSTRATTPDQDKSLGPPDDAMTDSFCSVNSLRSTDTREETLDAEAQLLQKSFANELTLNKDGQVTGGSLSALVEQLTLADVAPDPQFVAAFFITFRCFTTPRELAQALIYRFDYIGDSKAVGIPVKLRVYNVFKGWLEVYWNPEADRTALGDIRYFALHKLKPCMESAGERLVELTRKITKSYADGTSTRTLLSGVGKTATSIDVQIEGGDNTPEPIVTKAQLNALRSATSGGTASFSVLDLDPLELARQMTVMASSIFCDIQPEELLSLEWTKRDSKRAQNVRNMCVLNTDVAHVVGDTILSPEDAKKRSLVIKHWSKVAMRCLELSNYESLMAIMCSLNSSVVQRLKRTWEVVSKKTKARLAELNTIVDFSRNQASLRKRLEKPFAPCLPFLGIYLTDLTMVDAGNPKLRELPGSTSTTGDPISVINFDKHMRMAKIVSHVQRFQVPYKLKEVSEIQDWMNMHLERMREGHAQMIGNFHRRSLYIEPKADLSTAPRMPDLRRATEPITASERLTEDRSRTATSVHPTVKSFKGHGQTFELLLKANFKLRNKPEMPRLPDEQAQDGPLEG